MTIPLSGNHLRQSPSNTPLTVNDCRQSQQPTTHLSWMRDGLHLPHEWRAPVVLELGVERGRGKRGRGRWWGVKRLFMEATGEADGEGVMQLSIRTGEQALQLVTAVSADQVNGIEVQYYST